MFDDQPIEETLEAVEVVEVEEEVGELPTEEVTTE